MLQLTRLVSDTGAVLADVTQSKLSLDLLLDFLPRAARLLAFFLDELRILVIFNLEDE